MAKQLIHTQNCSVDIWTDQHFAYRQLLSETEAQNVIWTKAEPQNPAPFSGEYRSKLRILVGDPSVCAIGDVIVEAFGSPPPTNISSELAQHRKTCPWIILDYLSAESWVESYHLATSIEPSTGTRKLFFYPGFNQKTGGLIREPWLESISGEKPASRNGVIKARKLFVFAYPQAPVMQLAQALSKLDYLDYAGEILETSEFSARVRPIAFVPQSEFDQLLQRYDWLFVRGEDSFVRAQYAGKPFVWNIYPTEDGAHWTKLRAFFDKYSERLSPQAKDALWLLWACWNAQAVDMSVSDDASDGVANQQTSTEPAQLSRCQHTIHQCWVNILQFEQELQINAIAWRRYLFSQPDLVTQLCELIRYEMQGI